MSIHTQDIQIDGIDIEITFDGIHSQKSSGLTDPGNDEEIQIVKVVINNKDCSAMLEVCAFGEILERELYKSLADGTR
jgi:hypothetical protein